jgi:hypothetical protein
VSSKFANRTPAIRPPTVCHKGPNYPPIPTIPPESYPLYASVDWHTWDSPAETPLVTFLRLEPNPPEMTWEGESEPASYVLAIEITLHPETSTLDAWLALFSGNTLQSEYSLQGATPRRAEPLDSGTLIFDRQDDGRHITARVTA